MRRPNLCHYPDCAGRTFPDSRYCDRHAAERFVFPVSGLVIPGHSGTVWSFQRPGERWDCGTAPLFRTQAQAREGKRVALALERIDDRIFQRQESMAPNTLAGDFEGGSR